MPKSEKTTDVHVQAWVPAKVGRWVKREARRRGLPAAAFLRAVLVEKEGAGTEEKRSAFVRWEDL